MYTASLDNGLRIIFQPSESEVVYCGYVICAGTRHEAPEDSGMAHFIEHMSFKGTQRRKSRQINDYLERVGGELNAFTSKQETVYCATVLRRDVHRAVDILTDMVFHSVYPQNEIEKEVEVIIDEIDSYKDSPSELIFDEFEQLLFGDTSLGRDILGDKNRLRSYTTADALRFTGEHYRPDNAVFYLYGKVDWPQLLRRLEKAHAAAAMAPMDSATAEQNFKKAVQPFADFTAPSTVRVNRGTHQAHVVMGAPTFSAGDARRYALTLLNNIVGGPSMNSRLNMAVRERHGLVYSIDTYLNTYPDTGFWSLYFGCDTEDVTRCRQLVARELQRLCDKPLSPAALRVAKAQLCGQIGISCDHSESFAVAMAKQYAHTGTQRDIAKIMSGIQAVSAEEVQDLARTIYDPEGIYTLIYR